MNYIVSILTELLNKLDRRQMKFGDTNLSRSISLDNKEDSHIFCKYWADDCYLYREEIHDAVSQLEKLGFVQAKYDRATSLLVKVILVEKNAAVAYSYLNRIPAIARVYDDASKCEKLLYTLPELSVAYSFLQHMVNLLKDRKPCRKYFNSFDELEQYVNAVRAIESNDDEVLLRNFSKKNFKDSKFLEKKSAKLLMIFNEYGCNQFDSFYALCEHYHIVRHTGYALIKHGLRFKVNQQEIDLDSLGTDFALSDYAIEHMEVTEVKCRKVVTVENLTTFHYFDDNAIVIYLGGFHNSVKRKLLLKLKAIDARLEWYHFGDIDWGGFEIFIDLKRKTGIDFNPLMMGVEELNKYKDECVQLTSDDKSRLQRLLNDPDAEIFYPVIEFMLENNYKLEQESVVLQRF